MNRAIGAALLVVGAILLFMAFNASQSVANDISRFFTGEFTDKTVWMLVGGAAAAVAGLVMVAMPGRAARA